MVIKLGGISNSVHISYIDSVKTFQYSYGQLSSFCVAMLLLFTSIVSIGYANHPSAGLMLAGGLAFLTRIIVTEIQVTDLKRYLNSEFIGVDTE